ncbi:MAG: hypothetical protein ABIG86_00900 [Patescibacteria group bacterium]
MKQKLFLFEDFVPEGRRIIEQLLLAHDYEIGEPADIVLVMLYPRHLHLAVEAYSHAVQDKRRRVIFLRVGMGSLNEWRTVFRAEIGGGHRIVYDVVGFPYGDVSAKAFLQSLSDCIDANK